MVASEAEGSSTTPSPQLVFVATELCPTLGREVERERQRERERGSECSFRAYGKGARARDFGVSKS